MRGRNVRGGGGGAPGYRGRNVRGRSATSNGIGLAGFILALAALLLSWEARFGALLWLLGAIFSVVGLFREPKGFAIAGTIISFIGIFIFIFLVGLALIF